MSQKVDIWMPLYVGDYLASTSHLSTEEHGAYLLLLMHYWKTGKPLPDDDKKLANIARLSPDDWLNIKQTISEFFVIDNGEWSQQRLERDRERAIHNRRVASEKGHKGANTRWHSDDASENDIDDKIDALFDNGNEDPSSIS